MIKDINIESDILDKMYSKASEDNNIRIRRQTTENIFEHEDNKNSDIYELKQNNDVYDIEFGEYIKQEIKNIPKTKNIGRMICGLIFFVFALYVIFQKIIEFLTIYNYWYINNDDVYINNLRNGYHNEIAYNNGTEYFLRVHNNFDNNNVFSILDHTKK
jgi:hypothetical protein